MAASTLSPVILEAMARTLSDHDLLRFMLSSKETINATLNVLSTVGYVNYHDQNFEEEPCITFKMRGDNKRKVVLNYVTQSNPLFNFILKYVNSHLSKLEIGEMATIEPWVLNTLISSKLRQLTLGMVLSKDQQHLLKRFSNLTEIKYPNFDLFITNNFVPNSCKKIIIDHIDFHEFELISTQFKKFKPTKVKELLICDCETKVFLNDYDRNADDLYPGYWKKLLKFFRAAFPSLKILNVSVSGRNSDPFQRIFNEATLIANHTFDILPSHVEGAIYFNVLIVPNQWLAVEAVFNKVVHEDITKNDVTEEETRFNEDVRRAFKNRRFPRYFNDYPFKINFTRIPDTKFECKLHYYAKWEEYDFDALNDIEYRITIDPAEPTIEETAQEHSEAENMNGNDANIEEGLSFDLVTARDAVFSNDEALIRTTESEYSMSLLEEPIDLVTARDNFWSLESQSSCTTASDTDETTTTE